MRSTKVDPDGKISVFQIKVPFWLAMGQYEKVSTSDLIAHVRDVAAELRRRK